jgi:Uma2 family endonuclease
MIQRLTALSIDQYEQMIVDGVFASDERVELIRGELHNMSPAGPFHSDLLGHLIHWSVPHCNSAGYRCFAQPGITLAESESIPEPDLVWVRNRKYQKARPQAADVALAIEISHSSLNYDRKIKSPLYAEAGIADYWIVNCIDRCIEVHRQPVDGEYRERFVVEIGGKVSPLVAPAASLDVAELFADE